MTAATLTAYEAKKRKAGQRQRVQAADDRELYPLPPIKDPARRVRCSKSLLAFMLEYFPEVFYLDMSPDHLHVISQLELAIPLQLQVALAMSRGSGKTSLVTIAAIWAIVTGRSRFVVIVAADSTKAENLLESIRTHFQQNSGLLADFPEIAIPLKRLGKNNQRRFLYRGNEVIISSTKTEIQFANIPGSPASGSLIYTAGITGAIRGHQKTLASGEVIRPDFALVDDFQTDDSAKSETQNADRLALIKGAVLGLAGPDVDIACVACITVIQQNDAADQLLDRKKHPAWRGMRFALMESMPESELWQEYARIRELEQQDDENQTGKTPKATAYYRKNRRAMDAGAEPRWSQRFNKRTAISAVQHAMNILQDRGAKVFWSEYQNQPQEDETVDLSLKVADIKARLSRVPRGIVPLQATKLAGFVDCHEKLLYWMVVAAAPDASMWVVDYGTYPEQQLSVFQMRGVSTHIPKVHRDIPTPEARLYRALHLTWDRILGEGFRRPDGIQIPVDICLTDAQWGDMTKTVYQAVSEHEHKARLFPSHGRFVGAAQVQISNWKKRDGETIGDEWRCGPNRGMLRFTHDANHWKTFAAARLLAAMGSPGAARLFGNDEEAHELLAQHFCAETATEVASKYRRINEWRLKAARHDNHWWDCFVGCCVGLSAQGIEVLEDIKPPPKKSTGPTESTDLF